MDSLVREAGTAEKKEEEQQQQQQQQRVVTRFTQEANSQTDRRSWMRSCARAPASEPRSRRMWVGSLCTYNNKTPLLTKFPCFFLEPSFFFVSNWRFFFKMAKHMLLLFFWLTLICWRFYFSNFDF
jgi:hypothetical protein